MDDRFAMSRDVQEVSNVERKQFYNICIRRFYMIYIDHVRWF